MLNDPQKDHLYIFKLIKKSKLTERTNDRCFTDNAKVKSQKAKGKNIIMKNN